MTSPGTTRWQDAAACHGFDTEFFFPQRGEFPATAFATCRRCPVQPECLEHALTLPERFGVWGGTSERQRRRLRAERRARRLAAGESVA
jgi:WhiB family redox-sensing transcriptional regulator